VTGGAFADLERCALVSRMIECLPGSTSEKVLSNPGLMKLLADVDRLESHLSACEVECRPMHGADSGPLLLTARQPVPAPVECLHWASAGSSKVRPVAAVILFWILRGGHLASTSKKESREQVRQKAAEYMVAR
jgi:hypothetical protein